MYRYLFILGRKSEIAFHELETVLQRLPQKNNIRCQQLQNTAIVSTITELDCKDLIQTLGGTVKIVKLGKTVELLKINNTLLTILRNESIGKAKLIFGISLIESPDSSYRFSIPKELKNRLAKEGIISRYVMPRNANELSSAQVALGKIIEYYLFWINKKQKSLIHHNDIKTGVLIGKTMVVQDFQGFAKRDYKRPFIAPKEGMLPPKVARMMVNLGFQNSPTIKSWLLDPFCGTGTIAMEAMMLNINTLNNDISATKVSGTKRNLNWLSQQEKRKSSFKVFQHDATKVSEVISRKVDCIVTEPYLGPPHITREKVDNLIKGLNKLYLGAMKNWRICLQSKGRIVIALPEFSVSTKTKSASLIIDMRENLGYTLVAGPMEYERGRANIKRLIYVLEKK